MASVKMPESSLLAVDAWVRQKSGYQRRNSLENMAVSNWWLQQFLKIFKKLEEKILFWYKQLFFSFHPIFLLNWEKNRIIFSSNFFVDQIWSRISIFLGQNIHPTLNLSKFCLSFCAWVSSQYVSLKHVHNSFRLDQTLWNSLRQIRALFFFLSLVVVILNFPNRKTLARPFFI